MAVCMGMIGMSSDAFWNSSLKEVFIAIEGFREFNTTGDDTTPLSEDELKELTELYPDEIE